jgi:excisionase family DNA binding protein
MITNVETDIEPFIVKPRDARRLLSVGQTTLYELLKTGELESFLDGRSRKITVESIRRYIARRLHPAEGANTDLRPRRSDRSRKSQES